MANRNINVTRREVLKIALWGGAGVLLGGCSQEEWNDHSPEERRRLVDEEVSAWLKYGQESAISQFNARHILVSEVLNTPSYGYTHPEWAATATLVASDPNIVNLQVNDCNVRAGGLDSRFQCDQLYSIFDVANTLTDTAIPLPPNETHPPSRLTLILNADNQPEGFTYFPRLFPPKTSTRNKRVQAVGFYLSKEDLVTAISQLDQAPRTLSQSQINTLATKIVKAAPSITCEQPAFTPEMLAITRQIISHLPAIQGFQSSQECYFNGKAGPNEPLYSLEIIFNPNKYNKVQAEESFHQLQIAIQMTERHYEKVYHQYPTLLSPDVLTQALEGRSLENVPLNQRFPKIFYTDYTSGCYTLGLNARYVDEENPEKNRGIKAWLALPVKDNAKKN